MNLRFTKMHSCGNDFIVLDGVREALSPTVEWIQRLSDRHTGIGFDQCLLLERNKTGDADFFYRIFNADGQEVGQCANGVRCLGHFLFYSGLTRKKVLSVQTHTTIMQLELHEEGKVVVAILPPPKLDPNDIPLSVSHYAPHYFLPLTGLENHLARENVLAVKKALELGQGKMQEKAWKKSTEAEVTSTTHQVLHALNVGNPHAVIKVESVENIDVNILGKAISEHPWFSEQANVGFMAWLDPSHIVLRVYERGCGETLSCGSGAVAAAVVSRLYYQGAESIRVSLPGGELTVEWPDKESPIFLYGPTTLVYEGVLIEG